MSVTALDPKTRRRTPSSRAVKGALALGIAGLLLLSGFGSFALWTSSVSLDGGAVSAGKLELTNPSAGVWRDISAGGPGVTVPDITEFRIVPGDKLSYSASATVAAQGDNLRATIAADPTSVTGDAALLADVTVTTAVTVDGVPISAITEANDGQVVNTLVTFAFAASSTNATQQQNLDLSQLKLTLQQNAR